MNLSEIGKLNIFNNATYEEIVLFINSFYGLADDCRDALYAKFDHIDEDTLSNIMLNEHNNWIRNNHHKYLHHGPNILKMFNKYATDFPAQTDIIVNMAIYMRISPTNLCRILISEKYKNVLSKARISALIRNWHLINDHILANNVQAAICSDFNDSPVIDLAHQCVGQEFEEKLKTSALNAGLKYLDEHALRRIGFDKTPDLMLALPCIYKGKIIHWIESKAVFGDMKTHSRNLTQQLACYSNRYGAGIIIYWLGFESEILDLKENGDNLFILNHFPEKSDFTLMNIGQ